MRQWMEAHPDTTPIIVPRADYNPSMTPEGAALMMEFINEHPINAPIVPPRVDYNPYAIIQPQHSITCSTLGGITNCW
jgi:hypothetical protein